MCFLLITEVTSGHVSAAIAEGNIGVVVGTGTNAERFPAAIAMFGNRDPDSLYSVGVNLVLPPVDQRELCHYPEESILLLAAQSSSSIAYYNDTSETDSLNHTTTTALNNATSMTGNTSIASNSIESTNIAIFVGWGGCLANEKAIVAAALQQNYTQFGTVTHLIVYNTNKDEMDDLFSLTTDKDKFLSRDISVVFVSTRTGRDILDIMMNAEQTEERYANPLFLGPGNDAWYMPISFEEVYNSTGGFHGSDPYNDNFGDDMIYPPTQRQSNTNVEVDDFYWFRLIIFSLLVVSPCFRAVYLWYAGGARIRFRYNENGRIVGLQYTPPMPYWFAPRPDESYAQPASRMTQEQVMALPEIVYEENLAVDPLLRTEGDAGQASEITAPAAVQTSGDGLSEQENSNNKQQQTGNTTDSHLADEEQALPQPHGTVERNPSEMHSTCSICIDDFEHGEKLRMLPRCRHIFHTDCILPWLTERQGCCPLCKTEVIEPEHGEGSVGYDEDHYHGQGTGASSTQTESVDTAVNESRRNTTRLSTLRSSPPLADGDPEIAVHPANALEASDNFRNPNNRIEPNR